MSDGSEFTSSIRDALRPGMTVALGDGVGAVGVLDDGTSIAAAICAAAAAIGDIRLVLGWLPAPLDGLQTDAFAEVAALMPGWGTRGLLRGRSARFIPTSLAATPGLLTGPLRPDLLITRLARSQGGLRFGTEVSWQRALVDAGIPVLAITDPAMPVASAGGPLDGSLIRVIGRSQDGPVQVPPKPPDPLHEALADAVLRWIPPGARVQYGPGQLGTALLRRAQVPMQLDTGLLTDAVVDLHRRDLLVGVPSATYLIGSQRLYDWADQRPILHGIDHTHDVTRLSRGEAFIAVNTAIEIDPVGQVNVEGVGDKVVGGIGGHPDFCAGAHRNPGGLSIIAVPSDFGGRSPLVDRLSRPASTPGYDVDVIVTESGFADLRTASWAGRRRAIGSLFGA